MYGRFDSTSTSTENVGSGAAGRRGFTVVAQSWFSSSCGVKVLGRRTVLSDISKT
jgi:hypothetical protein